MFVVEKGGESDILIQGEHQQQELEVNLLLGNRANLDLDQSQQQQRE